MNPILLIPARLASTRLPAKPLADIRGVPMIVRVLRQAEAAGLGPVVVAAGEQEIVAALRVQLFQRGMDAVRTGRQIGIGENCLPARRFDRGGDFGVTGRYRHRSQTCRLGLAEHAHDHGHPADIRQGLCR